MNHEQVLAWHLTVQTYLGTKVVSVRLSSIHAKILANGQKPLNGGMILARWDDVAEGNST
jgi:hypothetical protein